VRVGKIKAKSSDLLSSDNKKVTKKGVGRSPGEDREGLQERVDKNVSEGEEMIREERTAKTPAARVKRLK